MKRIRAQTLLLFLFLAAPLISLFPAPSNAQQSQVTLGPEVLEERVDCLIICLRQEKGMQIPDDFKTASGLDKALGEIEKTGVVIEAEKAECALNKAVKDILSTFLGQLPEDNPYRKFVLDLLEAVDELPEGFCEPEAYETGEGFGVEGRETDDARERYRDPPIRPIVETGNFIFYGESYTLQEEAGVVPNGILLMSDDPFLYTETMSEDFLAGIRYPPFIAPLWILSHDESPNFEPDDEGKFPPIEEIFDAPGVTGTDAFFRYAYNTREAAPTTPFSATLYTNDDSKESDWILFSYGDVTLPYEEYATFVGLAPGDGSENHPGPGAKRGLAPRDLSGESGNRILFGDGSEYLSIFEFFGGYAYLNNLMDEEDTFAPCEPTGVFDLADHFLIFRPDGASRYTLTSGTRKMVVDSLGLDERESSLDTAIINLREPDLLAKVDGNAFQTGVYFWDTPDPNPDFPGIEEWPILWGDKDNGNYYYRYGLQTVGQNGEGDNPRLFSDSDKKPLDTPNKINGSGLLAYAVQVEEDRLNKRIIQMARDADAMKLRVDTIRNQLQCGGIRARDALFTQEADAQSGRVTRDRYGNWVRAQQYILRPPDGKTVQVLNVSLRGQDAGNMAGLSTMDFTTTFMETYEKGRDLRSLPWTDWLATASSEKGKRGVFTDADALRLDSMYVKFTNPGGEYLKEARSFGTTDVPCFQTLSSETLTLSSANGGVEQYAFNKDATVPGTYDIAARSNGFAYEFNGSQIDVAFYKADDFGDNPAEALGNSPGKKEVPSDIWNALRVNENLLSGAPQIGNNNLEIAIDRDRGFFGKPIDVIYIPMSRMLWKKTESVDEPS